MNHRAVFLGMVTLVLSLWSVADQGKVERSFPLDGVARVILRASQAERASRVERAGLTLKISGMPRGGAKGYHSSDPNWKETPPAEWGLNFVARRFGDTLVVSTENEIRYIHHYYALHDITVELPASVTLIREPRKLTGDGAPNLEPPT
jgi:hypothetical protein